MDIYRQKSKFKLLLIILGLIIVLVSLLYNNRLASKLAVEEQKKAEILRNTYNAIFNAPLEEDLSFEQSIIEKNNTIPIIITDSMDNILFFGNIDSTKIKRNANYVQQRLQRIKATQEPLTFEIGENTGELQYLFYEHSSLLRQLKYYPFIQFAILGLFLGIGYLAFSFSRRSEQNRVWVGMAKETAHQLGTPLSSLVGWVEYLKEEYQDNPEAIKIFGEMEKDTERLELVTDRFSKIGSKPNLKPHLISEQLTASLRYIKRRASDKVSFDLQISNEQLKANMNPALFNWVLENLLKNALDAMDGKGNIQISLIDKKEDIIIDVTDDGKGMSKNLQSRVFQPGISTKKRGWGLGLTLSKRIIEEYHNGKIFVKESQLGKGTTFRIVIPAV